MIKLSSTRTISICVNIVIAIVGVVIGSALPFGRDHVEPYEIAPGFKKEVDEMFRRYQQGEVVYYRNLPVLGGTLNCDIVENHVAGAEYGFAAVENGPFRIWYVDHGYEIRSYRTGYLFVVVEQRYANELDRNPATSRVQPP